MASDQFQIVGTTIAGNYEVQAVVAEGGFAVVYRARHMGFDAPVALKCLKLSSKLAKDREEQFLAQFKGEAALLFQLSASIPTVVRPLHIDAMTTRDGSFVPYMVLEWLEGETLARITEERATDLRPAPPLKKIVRLLTPVAQALERAHNFTANGKSVSIVHCDVKPENIFVASVAGEQVVKILDFGVARAQSVASQVAGAVDKAASPGSFTPAYAAPEQWAPDKYGETGPWTDVWGLALVLVETMAGRPIIDGDVGAMMGLALDPMARPTPRNNDIEVPEAVEEVFERAMALRPQDRYAHAGLFWDDLQIALGMKEGRPRDARREVGTMIREERIEVAKPKVVPRIKKLQLAAAKPAPKPFAQARGRLTIDDPFDHDDGLSLEAAGPGMGLEAPISALSADEPFARPAPRPPPANRPAPAPAVPAPGRGPAPRRESLEFKLPSEPPPPLGADLEAAIPSIPPAGELAPERLFAGGQGTPVVGRAPAAAAAAFAPAQPDFAPALAPPPQAAPPAPTPPAAGVAGPARNQMPSGDFEFDLRQEQPSAPAVAPAFELEAPIPSGPPRRAADPDAGRARSHRNAETGDLELGAEAPSLRIGLRSELPPRPAAAPPRPAPQAPMGRRPPMPSRYDEPPPEHRRSDTGLWKTGIGLLIAAIAVGVAGSFFRDENGVSKLAVGPVSPTAVAGLLFAAGLGLIIYGLLPRDR